MTDVLCTKIIDVSRDQAGGDLRAAKEGGIDAVIIKATQGKDYVDPTFTGFVTEARAAGLLVGAYHFASNSEAGDAQADWFLQEVDKVGRQGLLLVLDWETNNSSSGTMTRENACRFVARVREKAGVVPVLYSYESFLLEKFRTSPDEVLASCPLWVASYSAPPRVPSAWSDWTMWQYSGNAGGPADQHKFPRVTPGFRCAVDRSAFKGTEDELRAWWEATAVRSSPQSTSMTG